MKANAICTHIAPNPHDFSALRKTYVRFLGLIKSKEEKDILQKREIY